MVDNTEAHIPIEYEWRPPWCSTCYSFRHVEAQCPTAPRWVPKKEKFDDKKDNQEPEDGMDQSKEASI